MPKFNHELFHQLVNEAWNDEEIDTEVRYQDISFGFRTFTFRKLYGQKDILDFHVLAEEACAGLKIEINKEIRSSAYLTIIPWEDGQYLKGYFKGADEGGRFWKGGIATVGIKVLYSPWKEFSVGDDIEGEVAEIQYLA